MKLDYFDTYYKDKLLNTGNEASAYNDRYNGFKIIFEELLKKKSSNFNIIETGTIRNPNEWNDGQSTLLFYDFLRHFGGNLISIDISTAHLGICDKFIKEYKFTDDTEHIPDFKQICGDSVEELNKLDSEFDFIYLDSFDLQLGNPEPSMVHHLKEMVSLGKVINKSKDLIMAVDDNFGDVGKGKYVMDWAKSVNAKILHKGYQVIFKIMVGD